MTEAVKEPVQGELPGVTPAPIAEPTTTVESSKEPSNLAPEKVVEPEPKVVSKHKTAEDRIRQLVAQRKEKEAALADKEIQIKKLEAEIQQKTALNVPRPNRDQFESDEKYEEARENFILKRAEQRFQELENQRDEVKKKEEYTKRSVQAWQPFKEIADTLDPEDYPDLEDALSGNDATGKGMYVPFTSNFVRTSPVGPQLAHHFYRNPDVIEEINKLDGYAQRVALEKIESEITKAKTTKPVTSAPAPITPVGGNAGNVTKRIEDMSDAEFDAMRREEVKKRRGY